MVLKETMKLLFSILIDSTFKVISDGFPWIIAILFFYLYTSANNYYFYSILVAAPIAALALFHLRLGNKKLTHVKKHDISVHLASMIFILLFSAAKDLVIFQAVLISTPPAIVTKEFVEKYLGHTRKNFEFTTAIAINSGTAIGLISCFLYLNYFTDRSELLENIIFCLMAVRLILTYTHQLSTLILKFPLISATKTIYLFRKSILWDSQFYKSQLHGINRHFPFLHYLMVGYWKGDRSSKHFNINNYISKNPDLTKYNGPKLFHAIIHGINEQRMYSEPDNYCDKDKILLLNHDKSHSLTPISLHIHAYYDEELWHIIEKVKDIKIIDEVIITIPFDSKVSDLSEMEVQSLLGKKSKKEIIRCENKGANIYPFLKLVNENKISNQVVCHLHTKRSPHLAFGKDWFTFLIDSLLPSECVVEQYSQAFSNDPRLGLLIPKYYKHLPNQPNHGRNKSKLTKLMQEYRINQLNVEDYPCGAMFWARKEIFYELSDIVKAPVFTNGTLSEDANLEHVIERFIGYLPKKYGKITRFVNHEN